MAEKTFDEYLKRKMVVVDYEAIPDTLEISLSRWTRIKKSPKTAEVKEILGLLQMGLDVAYLIRKFDLGKSGCTYEEIESLIQQASKKQLELGLSKNPA